MPTELVFLGPRRVGFREFEDPAQLGPREIYVRTLFSGISHGTEMNVYRGTCPEFHMSCGKGLYGEGPPAWQYPMTYGYEEVGRVVACGDAVHEVKDGDIVATIYGHREAAVIDLDQTFYLNVLPPGMEPEHGIFHALGAVALDAYLSSEIRLGESAVVLGLGIIGQFIVQLCKLGGVDPVIVVDPIAPRRERALACGADYELDPSGCDVAVEVRRILGSLGADVVFDASGSYAALHEAIRCGAPIYGRVMAIGWYQGEGHGLRLGEESHHSSFGRGGTCQIRANNHRAPPARPAGERDRRVGGTDRACRGTQAIGGTGGCGGPGSGATPSCGGRRHGSPGVAPVRDPGGCGHLCHARRYAAGRGAGRGGRLSAHLSPRRIHGQGCRGREARPV
jgi:2-desacetyl-2-hydroxyethyl bacteriochlorophyllide A dehydrogenase